MDIQSDVEKFMRSADQPTKTVPAFAATEQEQLYMNLITEEYEELLEAFANKDIVEVADAVCDIIWVLSGLASTLGIPIEACWNEVRASNNSKVVDGRMIKDEAGKVMKPDGYFRPNLKKVMFS